MNAPRAMPHVAIVGRPNVGKSALFNRLVGRNIAIVHDQPGITRDRISATCNRGTRPFAVWDTGGIGGAGETELFADVQRAVEEALRESDVLVFLVDAQHGLSPIDQELARMLRKSRQPIVLVINKIDDPKHEDLAADFAALGFAHTVSISAAHGRGISDLVDEIDKLLPAEIKHQTSNIKHPIALAIVGRPNAGKSSFINAIVRDRRSIVSERPGTTRDAVDIYYERNGAQFLFIDTAGMRKRGKHSTSVEVFSVMRAERTIRRADLCVLIVDLTSGVTAQDKKIAGLIQNAEKPALVVLNKWDLVKPKRRAGDAIKSTVDLVREKLFFLDYAPVLVASAVTGENVERLFKLIEKIQRAAEAHIGTGVLNRLLRDAIAANPPPMVSGKRLKLFYAAQANAEDDRASQDRQCLAPPRFVLFVNQPKLLRETYRRYLEARIREAEPYPGLPILLSCRARTAGHSERSRGIPSKSP